MRFVIPLFLIKILICSNPNVFAQPMYGIAGIRDALPIEFPYIVSIVRTENPHPNDPTIDHLCTGTLITTQDVLTAASCLKAEDWEFTAVSFGRNDMRIGTRYSIAWWITYNQWMEMVQGELQFSKNNIATIRLTQHVPEDTLIARFSSIPIPEVYGYNVLIAGWGQNHIHQVNPLMQVTEQSILYMDECRRFVSDMIRTRFDLNSRFICTRANPRVVLSYGDIGAPVLLNGKIIAINTSTEPRRDHTINTSKINIHLTTNFYRNFLFSMIDPNFTFGL